MGHPTPGTADKRSCWFRLQRRLCGAGFGLYPIALQVAVETGAANAENLGGAKAIAVAHLQNFADMQFADFVETQRAPFLVIVKYRRAMLQIFRQVGDVDEIAGGGDTGGRNYVFQFAHITWPGMLQQDGLRAAGEPGNVFGVSVVVFLKEKLDEQGNVFQALRK